MPALTFTGHARQQMRERQIPEDAVYHVVGDADEELPREDDCTEYTGRWEERTIFVVACGEDEPFRVRTVIDKTRGRRKRR